MYNINEEIKEEIKNLNKIILEKYQDYFNLDKDDFNKLLSEKVGVFYPLNSLPAEELVKFGEVVGVDGSVNKAGGAFPHFVEIYQGLAKSTKGEEIYLNEVYTPLLDKIEDDFSQEEENKSSLTRNKKLAQIEISAAIEMAKKLKKGIIIMDGGLIRYTILDSSLWQELKEICLEKNIILIGLIKDIKTNIISSAIFGRDDIFDRELLLGRLQYGDLFLIDDSVNKKYKEGFSSAFLRPAKSSNTVGIDILEEQKEDLVSASNLVFTLTPEDSRGVPLWLDIVDREVRITDEYMKALLEEFLDREVYNRFFIAERDLRSF